MKTICKWIVLVAFISVMSLSMSSCDGSGFVSGPVTSGGVGLTGVTITVSDASTGNFYTVQTTNINGHYLFLAKNGTYSITPSKPGYTFSPASIIVTVHNEDIPEQQFTAKVIPSGSLDTTFGTGGIVTTSVGSGDAYARALGIQSDGRIVVAGYSYNGSNYDFALMRYNADGSLDKTFGAGGIVTTAVGSGDDYARALGIQSDGRIVVVGYSYNGSKNDFALARYNADGSLDATFGTGGIVTTSVGRTADYAYALGIQSDGRIVIAGNSFNLDIADNRFTLVRYNTDGSLDTTFGTGGTVITSVGSRYGYATTLGIQSDGRIVAAGGCNNGRSIDFALARYNTDSSLDATFGTGGIVNTTLKIDGTDTVDTLGIQSDGRIVVAGYSYSGSNSDFALVRYNADGSLDTTFGTGGIVTTNVLGSNDIPYALGIQSDGRIVLVGRSYNGSNYDFALVRYNADGSLDATFGTDGIVTTAVGSGDDYAYALGIQPDGRIVVAGFSNIGNNDNFSLVRYWP
jgi:uncharacterized delta-60 repeat protein